MKLLSAITVAMLMLAGSAQAEQTRTLHGLFCNTEAQARDVLEHFVTGVSLQGAVAMINAGAVNCVVANRIQYVVSRPLIIDTVAKGGFELTLYEASLIGVLVGGNNRPIQPPLRTYFVLDRRLGGVAVLGGT